MAFITRHNCERMIRRIPTAKMKPVIESLFLDMKLALFSSVEEQRLHAFRELVRHPELFIDRYYDVLAVCDTLTFVEPERAPCYHARPDCERMRASFINYYLPGEVRERGPAEIDRFRKWFQEHRHVLEVDDAEDRFLVMMATAFALPLTHLQKVAADNSGYSRVENWSLQDLEASIKELLRDVDQFYAASWRNEAVLNQYMKWSFLRNEAIPLKYNRTGVSDETVRTVLEKFHSTFKAPLMRRLVTYYRVQYNPELSFEGRLLERLGFRECGGCRMAPIHLIGFRSADTAAYFDRNLQAAS